MENICDPDILWSALMIVTASCAGLTLTGGAFLKGSIQEYIEDKTKTFVYDDNKPLDTQIFHNYITENILIIVLMFLISSILIIPYLVLDWHWGVYISYSLFYGTIISLIFFISVHIYDFRRIANSIIPSYISQSEQITYQDITTVGNAGRESPIFITSNSFKDYTLLEQDLGWNEKDAYILSVDTDGLSIENAVDNNSFSSQKIKDSMDKSGFEINNQIYPALVLPEAAKELKHELEAIFNNRVVVLIGPETTDRVGEWWKENWPARRKSIS